MKVVIVGAGPSGVMCAIQLAKRGEQVTILDHNPNILRKLEASGGGRCNITNVHTKEEFMKQIAHNGKFLYSSLHTFNNNDLRDYIERIGVPTKEEGPKVFPKSDKSTDISAALEKELKKYDVKIKTSVEVRDIDFNNKTVTTSNGVFSADKIVMATGGNTRKELGATDFSLRMAMKYKLSLIDPWAANASLVMRKNTYAKSLQGVTIQKVAISYKKQRVVDDLLFTHFGITGPGPIAASCWLKGDETITLDFKPEISKEEIVETVRKWRSKQIKNSLSFLKLPGKFIDVIIGEHGDTRCSDIKKDDLNKIVNQIKENRIELYAKSEYDNAFTMGGGISSNEISPKDFQLKKFPGIFVLGEAIDIVTRTGGFNLTACFSMGYNCGVNMKM